MNINTTIQTGLQGVQQGIDGVDRAATDIVRTGTVDSVEGGEVVEPIIELRLYERSVQASAQVVRTADEVLGTLLDTLAGAYYFKILLSLFSKFTFTHRLYITLPCIVPSEFYIDPLVISFPTLMHLKRYRSKLCVTGVL